MYILPPGAPSASLSFLLSVIVAALLCPVLAGPTTPPDRDTAPQHKNIILEIVQQCSIFWKILFEIKCHFE